MIKSIYLLSSHRASRILESFDVWVNSYILEARDLDIEDDDGIALMLKEGEHFS